MSQFIPRLKPHGTLRIEDKKVSVMSQFIPRLNLKAFLEAFEGCVSVMSQFIPRLNQKNNQGGYNWVSFSNVSIYTPLKH